MTLAQFRTRYTQFAAVSDSLVQLFLDEAALMVGEGWGDLADLGLGLYTAHSIVVDAEEKARSAGAPTFAYAGDIVSKSVGSVSVSRSAALIQMQSENPLYRTTYGQKYLYHQALLGKGAMCTGTLKTDTTGQLSEPISISLPVGSTGNGEYIV